jgi:hypothetical protein
MEFAFIVFASLLSRVGYQMARTPVLPIFAADLGAMPELIGVIVAIAPINGWAAPQSSIWIARARENTSRPQPCAVEIGISKNASPKRAPKPITAIRQPHRTMTTGLRQITSLLA